MPKQTFYERARDYVAKHNPINRVLGQAEKAAAGQKQPAPKPVTDIPFGIRTDPSKPETMPQMTPAEKLREMQAPPKRKPKPKTTGV